MFDCAGPMRSETWFFQCTKLNVIGQWNSTVPIFDWYSNIFQIKGWQNSDHMWNSCEAGWVSFSVQLWGLTYKPSPGLSGKQSLKQTNYDMIVGTSVFTLITAKFNYLDWNQTIYTIDK